MEVFFDCRRISSSLQFYVNPTLCVVMKRTSFPPGQLISKRTDNTLIAQVVSSAVRQTFLILMSELARKSQTLQLDGSIKLGLLTMVAITRTMPTLNHTSLATVSRPIVTNTLRVRVTLPKGCWVRKTVQLYVFIVEGRTCTTPLSVLLEPA